MNVGATLRKAIATAGAVGLALVLAGPAQAQEATGTVSDPIVEGLIGPLGLAIGDNGSIYVAESFAGQITRVGPNGGRSVIVASPGESINGVDTSVLGRVVFTRSVGSAGPEEPATATTLERVQPNGTVTVLASLLDYEVANNPDGGQSYGFLDLPASCAAKVPDFFQPYTGIVESNPYKVASLSPFSFAVADAASNAIFGVTNSGTVSTIAVLPSVAQRITPGTALEFGLPLCTVGRVYSSEPVPTDVEVGPDGYLYVSSLPGSPEQANSGSVFRVDPNSGEVTRVARGFTGAVDLAIADDGTIYVAEIFGNRISSISTDGVVSTVVDVFSPGAVEFGPDGTLYATTGIFGPAGNVVVVTP